MKNLLRNSVVNMPNSLYSCTISLGGGGVFRTPLTSENKRHRTHSRAFYGNLQSNENIISKQNKKLSNFAFTYSNLIDKIQGTFSSVYFAFSGVKNDK